MSTPPTVTPSCTIHTIDGVQVTIVNGSPSYSYPTRYAEDARTRVVRRAYPNDTKAQREYGELLALYLRRLRVEGIEAPDQYRRDVGTVLVGLAKDVNARRELDRQVAALVAELAATDPDIAEVLGPAERFDDDQTADVDAELALAS